MSDLDVHKVTLSSGKVVYMRDMKIEDQELAAIAAGSKVSTDNLLANGVVMQKELLKNLLLKVDEKQLTAAEKEDLNKHFTFKDYQELQSVVNEIAGSEVKPGKMLIERVSSGSI